MVYTTMGYGLELVAGNTSISDPITLKEDHPCNILQRKALRRILGVNQNTPTLALFGETGLLEWSHLRIQAAINYRLKLASLPTTSPLRNIIDHFSNYPSQWWDYTTKAAEHFSIDLADQNPNQNITESIHTVYARKWNLMRQQLQLDPRTGSKTRYYLDLKETYGVEHYLHCIPKASLRMSLTKFRLRSHNLNVEIGSYARQNRDQKRLCQCCSVLEDESHVLFDCPRYASLQALFRNRLNRLGLDSPTSLSNLLSQTNTRTFPEIAILCSSIIKLKATSSTNA